MCIVPPDFTRHQSRSGALTQLAYKYYGDAVKDVIPALGCHKPVTEDERERMFGIVPKELFRVHDWRNDVVTVGNMKCCEVFEVVTKPPCPTHVLDLFLDVFPILLSWCCIGVSLF